MVIGFPCSRLLQRRFAASQSDGALVLVRTGAPAFQHGGRRGEFIGKS
jgi:hypothetical protein